MVSSINITNGNFTMEHLRTIKIPGRPGSEASFNDRALRDGWKGGNRVDGSLSLRFEVVVCDQGSV